MQTIILETQIAAPVERCFLLSLSIDLHKASTAKTGETAIAGVTHGLIGSNETVTWRGKHFGFWLTQKTRITAYDKPRFFQDTMEEGLFRSFVHDHTFVHTSDGTLMRDELRFAAPLGPLGWVADVFVLPSHLRRFLASRNATLKQVAESSENSWTHFIG